MRCWSQAVKCAGVNFCEEGNRKKSDLHKLQARQSIINIEHYFVAKNRKCKCEINETTLINGIH